MGERHGAQDSEEGGLVWSVWLRDCLLGCGRG